MKRASKFWDPALGSGSSSMGRKLMAKPMSLAKRTMSGSSSRLRLLTTQLMVGMAPGMPCTRWPMCVIVSTAASQAPGTSQM